MAQICVESCFLIEPCQYHVTFLLETSTIIQKLQKVASHFVSVNLYVYLSPFIYLLWYIKELLTVTEGKKGHFWMSLFVCLFVFIKCGDRMWKLKTTWFVSVMLTCFYYYFVIWLTNDMALQSLLYIITILAFRWEDKERFLFTIDHITGISYHILLLCWLGMIRAN